jgi:predicted transposase YdaD
MFYPSWAIIERRDYYSDNKEGYYQLIVKETEVRAKLEGKLETIPGLVKLGLTSQQIATALELPKETILQAIDSMS